MSEVDDLNMAQDPSAAPLLLVEKNSIPELMIPSFETSPTEESDLYTEDGTRIISPDSGSGSGYTKSVAESTKVSKAVSAPNETTQSIAVQSPTTSTSPSQQQQHQQHLDNDSAASSPTNPSAPLTSPPKAAKPPVRREHNEHQEMRSSPPPPPPAPPIAPPRADGSDATTAALNNLKAAPIPISQRGRVVSVDRVGYMRNSSSCAQDDEEDDDDISTSTVGSSSDGEGSYFSEHLPSPPRRRESLGSHNLNPRLLPPGAGSMSIASRNGRSNIQIPSLQTQNHYSVHESDLSLSSSSSEDDCSRIDDLERTYDMNRSISAPVQGINSKPRNHNNHNSHNNMSSVSLGHRGHSRTPSPNDGEKLQIIDAPVEDYPMPQPKNARLFPSTSSLVSSSSEDVGEKHLSAKSKHRRQSSYRSIGSLTSTGSAALPDKNKKWNESDGESDFERCKPPELVSFGGSGGSSRHSKSSSSKRSSSHDHRVPRNKSYNDSHKVQGVTTLSDDQMNAWRSGMVRADSYVSSSNGNASGQEISPDRRGNMENASVSASLSASSRHSKISRNGSGIFVYSEDETDESTKYREIMATNAAKSTLNGTTSLPSSNSLDRPSNAKRNRSFGSDLTNANTIEPTSRNALINPTPDRASAGRPNPEELMSSMSSHSPSALKMAQGMHQSTEKMINAGPSHSYTLYWKRWLMLMYIALLNLLSDWTCFSIAPITLLTAATFQIGNPEHLVTVFLLANTISTATEPIILARFGLRSTIVFGSFLLMCGNIVKSGGIPGILGAGIGEDVDNAWRLYAGFFIVGLSQPLYQCTPSVLSSAWFPEQERTMATSIALNANQIGIGCSFIFGSLLVATGDDIAEYFGLLSTLSTIVFFGCYLQFRDAPPSPPSQTARVMRGNSTFPFPQMNAMKQSIPHYTRRFQGPMGPGPMAAYERETKASRRPRNSTSSAGSSESRSSLNRTENETTNTSASRTSRRSKRSERKNRGSPSSAFHKSFSRNRSRRDSADGSLKSRESHRRQRSHGSRSVKSSSSIRSRRVDNAIGLAPSPAIGVESTEDLISEINRLEEEAESYGTIAPSPMMSGRVGPYGRREGDPSFYDTPQRGNDYGYQQHQWHQTQYGSASDIPVGPRHTPNMNQYYGHNYNIIPEQIPVDHVPDTPFANLRYSQPPMSGNYPSHVSQTPYGIPATPYDYGDAPVQYYPPMGDHRMMYQQPQIPAEYHHHHHQFHPSMHVPYHHIMQAPVYSQPNHRSNVRLPPSESIDDGVEPILTLAGSNLSIQIRDDQVFRSIRACFSRPGFIHTVITFAVSGIVLNTISTYFGPLLRLHDDAGRVSVGITGACFQLIVMISSLIVGKITDKSRAYYCVVIGLLLLGAMTLAECAINLEAERIANLKWTLLILAVFVGPLQPVATELGVDVVYPLSENTVLVVQQLASNLLSALFIPFFQVARNFAKDVEDFERPQYTFSFIMLMAAHVLATVFFATFNGKYRRLEHEQRRKKELLDSNKMNPKHLDSSRHSQKNIVLDEEQQALMSSDV